MGTFRADRINNLKGLNAYANHHLKHYRKVLNAHQEHKWITDKAKAALLELRTIIKKINIDLHPKNLDLYCSPRPLLEPISVEDFISNPQSSNHTIVGDYITNVMTQTNEMSVLFTLVSLAPEQNIVHDLIWMRLGTLTESMDIGLGKRDISILEKYLPDKIQVINQLVIPYYNAIPEHSSQMDLLRQAVVLSNEGDYLSCNIILVTITESLVRQLCLFIYSCQNKQLTAAEVETYVFKTFNSLDTLLSKGDWQYDFPVPLSEAIIKYRDVNDEALDRAREKYYQHLIAKEKVSKSIDSLTDYIRTAKLGDMNTRNTDTVSKEVDIIALHMGSFLTPVDSEVSINIRVILHFLIRKYKDERNLLIHGRFEKFNYKWKNLINFVAIIRVQEADLAYRKIYETKT